MNTAVLKSFAPMARRQLMEAVTRKLDFVLSAQTPDYLTTFAHQVAELRKLAKVDRAGLIERVAYTWFNRLTALRYLDARGWHPFRARVLTARRADETQPELLKLVRSGALPEELKAHTDPDRLNALLDGRIPSSEPQGEVYRHLVLAACRFYNALLPHLFERLDDDTELLLPDDLLTEQSIAQGFRTQITDDDCAEVELLGWLYQFYISEKKDTVMGRKATVPTEDIPAVTQLFTPHWIVRYLVENSLGRLWMLNRPGSRLRGQMPYYIEGEPEVDFIRIGMPQEIRLLDPAVGSGHMLTYAFELLGAIYEEDGYALSEIPGIILTHNLYGMDICPRAAQLASLALVLKAREKSRQFFQTDKFVRPNIICAEDVRFAESDLREYVAALDLGGLFDQPVLEMLRQFERATTLGSLIQPSLDDNGIASVRAVIEAQDMAGRLFLYQTHSRVVRALEQAEMLCQRYHVIVANPPYMGSGAMNDELKDFIEKRWSAGKADTYAAFMTRNLAMVLTGGTVAMITIPNWMFLTSFAPLREAVLNIGHVVNMAHCGRGIWGSDFGSCAFVLCANSRPDRLNKSGRYKRLFKRQGEVQSNEEIEANFFDVTTFPYYLATSSDFRGIPGSPIAYWASAGVRAAFAGGVSFADYFFSDGLTKTGDNEKFLRKGWEVSCSSGEDYDTYRVCVKGGDARKFYGNLDNLVRWTPTARQHYKTDFVARITPEYLWQSEGISWTKISSAGPTFRRFYPGMIAETGGPAIFAKEAGIPFINGALGFLCSSVCSTIATILNPTLNAQTNDILRLPLDVEAAKAACALADEAVSLSKADWDRSETSRDFLDLPILRAPLKAATVETSWQNSRADCEDAIRRMQRLETEINRLFIDAFGLQAELTPDVPADQITLSRPNARKDIAALLSYAVGCMMGRYSLDDRGLILANAGDTLEQYLTIVGKPKDELAFAPDENGIVPVLDGEWFEGDIVARTREFLRATFGESTFRENLRFIEDSLGKDLRKYFLTDFYKDHLQTYKKRPIYWLVQSPRKGFSVLIYLHRYTRDTMNLVLNKYLREYQTKLRNRNEHLARVLASEGSSTREKTEARKEVDRIGKTLHECEEWERGTVLPLAQARIELDLDDGVRVNYLKLGEALAPVAGMEIRGEL